MKNYIWDGEIDMGWEDMKSYLIEVSNKFITVHYIELCQTGRRAHEKAH